MSGTTRITWEPVRLEGRWVCCAGTYLSGKEVDDLSIHVKRSGEETTIDIRASRVRAQGVIGARGSLLDGALNGAARGAVRGLKGGAP